MMTLQVMLPQLFHNKVILSFTGAHIDDQAKSWINTFNTANRYMLLFMETLINSLFIVLIAEISSGGLKKLLKKEFKRVDNHFTTLNNYQSAFDSQNPHDFHYLLLFSFARVP